MRKQGHGRSSAGRGAVRLAAAGLAAAGLTLAASAAMAQKYGPGVTDKEIKIGTTTPLSGPASAYGSIGLGFKACFDQINDQGGINGRRINVILYDDAYSPPKTVEMTRQLVEQDQVLFIANETGTAPNVPVRKYLNQKKVPQLFVASGASLWADPKNYPWTMGWQPSYAIEAKVYAQYILKNLPDAKIGLLFQNDDSGKDYMTGFKEALGDKAKTMIVAEASYEVTDPTINSQIAQLKAAGVDVLFNTATPKFAAQSIRAIYDIGWKPTHFLSSISGNVGTVIRPAGPEKAVGIISSMYMKEPTDPQWANDEDVKAYHAWMDKYYPNGSRDDFGIVLGYATCDTTRKVIEMAGDELTRENIMKQATSLKNAVTPMLLPGSTISTGPDDYSPVKCRKLMRWNGERYELFGDLLCSDAAH